jgi:HEAT repeat protein
VNNRVLKSFIVCKNARINIFKYPAFSRIMEKNNEDGINNSLKGFPESLVKLINELLVTDDYSKKLSARETLVEMHKTIIPQMHKLLDSEDDLLRMEAAKIVELIADRRSIPFLLKLLDDTVFEIRWIAAEGLIKIGRQSICPLLKSVRDGRSSFFFNRGTHHILLGLVNEEEKKKIMPLLQILDNNLESGESAPAMAAIALKTVFACNT